MLNQIILDEIVSKSIGNDVFWVVFYVSSEDSNIDLISAGGEFKRDRRYYIASINKMFISALILKLIDQSKLRLQDKIAEYLTEDIIKDLHGYKRNDYSGTLTIMHLMSLTSGLPCCLADRQSNGKRAMSELIAGKDQAWSFERVVKEVKKMKPHFRPGQPDKARYGDTNHQLVSMIIENIVGKPIQTVLNEMFIELNLTDTYVFSETDDRSFIPIRYKSAVVNVPLFLSSTRNDIISTANDQMKFIKSFLNGYFFPKERLPEWHRDREV